MRSRLVEIEAPRKVRVREEQVEGPGEGEIVVETRVSAVSAGTELLFYRGDLPEGTPIDESLSALPGVFRYPIVYGYAAVGVAVAAGAGVPDDWLGRNVFAFSPHRSHFVVKVEDAVALPDGVEPERAVLLPTAETAVNFLLDGSPHIGERVLVVGQGVVGLMTTALLARFPLERLWTVDAIAARLSVSKHLGAMKTFRPGELDGADGSSAAADFDLAFEVSGQPSALSSVIRRMAVEGRIVVGSWYGTKAAPIDLGTHFHRRRLALVSSQVSRIAGKHAPRWSSRRRIETAFRALSSIPVERLVSHRLPLEEAPEAYRLLDESPADCLQVLLTYT